MLQEKTSPKVIRAVIAAGLLSFCGVLVETAMNITFPTLMKEFAITTSTVQWMTTIYLLVVATVVPLSAYLKRSFKAKSIFLFANILFFLGVVVDIIAPSFGLLLFGRVIQGIGVGIALPLMFNIILEQVPMGKIGVMMGVGTLITAIAPAIGPTFGGVVSSSLGWRFIFVLLIPILLISLFLGINAIEQKSPVKRERFDTISFLAIICLFVGLILGINNLSTGTFLSFPVLLPLFIGFVGLWVLIKRSATIEQPIVSLTVLRNKIFLGHVIAFFLFQLVNLGMSFLLPNYIQLVNGSSATLAGLLIFPGALVGAGFAPLSGTILDRLGARKPIILGISIIIVSLVFLSLFGLHVSNTMIMFLYALFMCGAGLSFGNIMTSGQKEVNLQERADANAIFNTLQQFAGAVGTTLVALIVAFSQSGTTTRYVQATAQGTRNAFLFLLILVIIEWLILVRVVGSDKK